MSSITLLSFYKRLEQIKSSIPVLWISISIWLFSHSLTYAQSYNYWSWNYNTPSTILGGAVVAGSAGPAAVYYNPSLIDQENLPSLSLSARTMTLRSYSAKNTIGNDINLNTSSFTIQPRFTSFIPKTKNNKIGIELTILSPSSYKNQITFSSEQLVDVIYRMDGKEIYTGYFENAIDYTDTWLGGGVSYQLLDRLYIGVSAFISVKNNIYRSRILTQANQLGDSILVNGNPQPAYIASNGFDEQFDYTTYSLVTKFGMNYISNNGHWRYGLTVTLPHINMFGNSRVYKSVFRSNVFINASNSFHPNQKFVLNYNSTNVTINTPLSAAVGVHYTTQEGRLKIMFSAEWFHKIDRYAIVSAQIDDKIPNYVEQEIGKEALGSYQHEARSVVNFAIGVKKTINETWIMLGGFRTDFSAGIDQNLRYIDEGVKSNLIYLDKYHFSAGPAIQIGRTQLITGLQYSFSFQENIKQIINFDNPIEYNSSTSQALEGNRLNKGTISSNEISIFLGLIVGLTK